MKTERRKKLEKQRNQLRNGGINNKYQLPFLTVRDRWVRQQVAEVEAKLKSV